ncbi:MAG: YlxR family protein [Candidatus Cloacimonetes bacterium]|jgi:predicted RNA-binding protein YlxR (DUF448 family)|nr:YlxR family protein [Candidatus Cloacimonadota bacterium]MCB5286311.1 YlxR family protein [Candidatus Cloacimonadota bacterium]MCK9185706.1 YlxR family protein [Candidatus Cloacimonadota bacterium]MCK9584968.1 YlxR family protein [Candidatus Cloacimonadota bacterium]MDY0228633.1 YlxR family protein [Candidatus Cloacimonadaceae bacterium]
MPNQNSKAGHKAIRTCVVCRGKSAQTELLSFILLPSGIVYDPARLLQARKYYVCPQQVCLNQLPKWRKKRQKGRRL